MDVAGGIRFKESETLTPGDAITVFDSEFGRVGLMICGDRDQFCPVDSLKRLVESLACRLELVRGADHFYFMKEKDLKEAIGTYLKF